MKDGFPDRQTENPSLLVSQVQALLLQRKFAEAEALCRPALRRDATPSAILHLLGLSLLEQGKSDEAAAAFKSALKQEPTRPDLNFNYALALHGAGQTATAIKRLRIAISVAPDVAQLHAKLGQLLSEQGELEPALESLERALEIEPDSPSALLNLSQVQLDLGRVDHAEGSIFRVLEAKPADPKATQALGRLRQFQGRFEEATLAFQQIIDAHPENVASYFSLCYSSRATEARRELIERMQAMTEEPGRSSEDLSLLHYALGKSLDDLGEYEAAMRHFDEANTCCQAARERAGRQFDRSIYSTNLDRIIEFCGSQNSSSPGPSASRPIFIVGMLRSGTTLVEQVLASHPMVAAGGELGYWVSTVTRSLSGGRAAKMTPEWLQDAVSGYERLLNGISSQAERITDKMPTNYQVLGAILSAYPRAKVIHCRRNPVDNCLSVYVTPNRRAPDFTHDRDDIVFAHREYERLMAHWRKAFPHAEILDVSYEELTSDFEVGARRIVEFAGLDWDEACARPDESSRTVNTPSQWQVRQPIYRSSVDRWKNYEPWLGGLKALIEPIT